MKYLTRKKKIIKTRNHYVTTFGLLTLPGQAGKLLIFALLGIIIINMIKSILNQHIK